MVLRKQIPRAGVGFLALACMGVGVVALQSYVLPDAESTYTSSVSRDGLTFGILGVLASAAHHVWRSTYVAQLEVSALQLLYNQAPLGAIALLYAVPWTDSFPVFGEVEGGTWMLVLMVSLVFFFFWSG